ncbi:Uncharacterised protein [Vibrio cholerae]|nr:Uncharacterised protein [Vibrio cholerae]CSB33636.1 Uncharacterised protein [Vibrio cholerae]CSB39108.1 Uncharacterised protein [Vibrio cholerae]CSB40961.1 Uncharacterised protein [Vibrio cholerae]CSB70044.1 Uncharacterised protein [Vibrio cholerae]
MGLASFRRFIAEAINIALHVRHLLLLLLIDGLLLKHFLRALSFKRRVVARVFIQRLIFNMHNAIDDWVEEIAVMGNQDQRAGVALQPTL